ncbi:MAG: restriction endonuclease subunit S [Nitrosomonas sp.]|nr:MAG: restriction endonuclease subunit S [Nitrosomonas sp.]
MSHFQEKTIAELIAERAILAIQDGNHGEKHPKSTDYVEEGIHFVMANDLNSGAVDLKGCSKIPESLASKLRIGFSVEGDVLLTHKGTIGNVAIVGSIAPYIMLTPQVTYYRTDNAKLSNKYLAYAFREPNFQKRMKSLAQQSTRPYIGITAQRNLKILWTDRETQESITEIISKYDDLIENNKRRIELLEDSARQLYKEWFVRFRFPGHEHAKIIDGVPEGWQKKPFSSVADFLNGFAFKPSHFEEDGLPIVKIPELKDGVSEKTPRNSGVDVPTSLHLEDGDLLFSWSGTLAVNVWASGPALLNQHLFKVKSTAELSRSFLLVALREAMPQFMNETTGATMKHIRRAALDKVQVIFPREHLLSEFEDFVTNCYEQVIYLYKQNISLTQARDILLPKLMSGEIAV